MTWSRMRPAIAADYPALLAGSGRPRVLARPAAERAVDRRDDLAALGPDRLDDVGGVAVQVQHHLGRRVVAVPDPGRVGAVRGGGDALAGVDQREPGALHEVRAAREAAQA